MEEQDLAQIIALILINKQAAFVNHTLNAGHDRACYELGVETGIKARRIAEGVFDGLSKA